MGLEGRGCEMTNACETMTILDWISLFIFIIFGSWKMIDLINLYAPKLSDWVINKIEKRK